MSRGTSLSALRDQLRAEIGASSNVAMGVNTLDAYDHLLRRTQDRLWHDFDWQFGYIVRQEQLFAGQQYYTFDQDLDWDRIRLAHVKYSEIWHPLEYGIGPSQYNAFDKARNMNAEPCLRWKHYEGNQFEVWPVPTSDNQYIRFEAIKKLPPLIAPSDTAVLDDTLIVLFAAAELLARSKAQDAQAKLAQATAHYNRLKGMGNKNESFVMGGGISEGERIRIVGGRTVRDDRPF